jgi:phospholipid transport system transporter-binding protein
MTAQSAASLVHNMTDYAHCVTLAGALTIESVGALYRDAKPFEKGENVVIDTSGVTAADTSGLALLTALIRRAQTSGASVKLQPLPSVLSSITEIYGLQEILSAYRA